MKYNFRSDYLEICSTEILEEIGKINFIQKDGYQMDNYTIDVKNMIKEKICNQNVDIHFMVGGTITNLTFIAHALRSFEAVISADSGHIAVHEAGAIEQTGHKIVIAESIDGKLCPSSVKKAVEEHVDCHMVKPKMVFISNSTEYGTIYTKSELVELYEFCQNNDLFLYLDGARISNALAAVNNDLDLADICKYTDAFYIGGTKNGAMLGEALIIKNDTIKEYFRHQIKSRGGLMAKGSLIAAQFKVLLGTSLSIDNAKHANEMASLIKNALVKNGFEIIYENHTNQVFVKMKKTYYERINELYGISTFAENNDEVVARFVTSFSTDKKNVEEFIEFLNGFNGNC